MVQSPNVVSLHIRELVSTDMIGKWPESNLESVMFAPDFVGFAFNSHWRRGSWWPI